jgi:NmrA-like family
MSNIPGQSLNNMQGVYNFALPIPTNSPIPLFDTENDSGKFVKAILLNREKVLGARIYGATDYYTPEQIIADFQAIKSTDGQGGGAKQVPEAMFKKILASKGLPEPLQEEMLENMLLMPQFGYYGGADLKESLAVSLKVP